MESNAKKIEAEEAVRELTLALLFLNRWRKCEGKKKCVEKRAVARKAVAEFIEMVETELYSRVRGYIARARAKVYVVANKEMVLAYWYWNVGREIVERQGGKERARYGDGLMKGLLSRLTSEFGAGYTMANLRNMRRFFLTFEKRYTLCSELGWS